MIAERRFEMRKTNYPITDAIIDFSLDGNKVRMLSLFDNVVFEADLDTNRCRIIGEYEANAPSSYCYSFQVGRYFIGAPSAVLDFLIMDVDRMEWARISVEERHGGVPICPDLKTWTAFGNGKYAWKTGFTYPAILKADLESGSVEYIANWLETVEKKMPKLKENAYFGNGYYIHNDMLVLPLFGCPGIFEMNMYTYEYCIHMFDPKYIGFRTLSGDGNELWMETIQGSFLCASLDWKIQEEISAVSINSVGSFAGGYWKPMIADNTIYLFPYYSPRILEIDRSTHKASISELNRMVKGNINATVFSSEAEICGNKLYFFGGDNKNKDFYVYDITKATLSKHIFYLDEIEGQEFLKRRLRNHKTLSETSYTPLTGFIRALHEV